VSCQCCRASHSKAVLSHSSVIMSYVCVQLLLYNSFVWPQLTCTICLATPSSFYKYICIQTISLSFSLIPDKCRPHVVPLSVSTCPFSSSLLRTSNFFWSCPQIIITNDIFWRFYYETVHKINDLNAY